MSKATLADRLLAQREFLVEVGPGLKVRLRRPGECEFPRSTPLGLVQAVAVGWEGFSEAVLFGEAIGASDPLAFDLDVWKAWIADKPTALAACCTRLMEVVEAHRATTEAASGN